MHFEVHNAMQVKCFNYKNVNIFIKIRNIDEAYKIKKTSIGINQELKQTLLFCSGWKWLTNGMELNWIEFQLATLVSLLLDEKSNSFLFANRQFLFQTKQESYMRNKNETRGFSLLLVDRELHRTPQRFDIGRTESLHATEESRNWSRASIWSGGGCAVRWAHWSLEKRMHDVVDAGADEGRAVPVMVRAD